MLPPCRLGVHCCSHCVYAAAVQGCGRPPSTNKTCTLADTVGACMQVPLLAVFSFPLLSSALSGRLSHGCGSLRRKHQEAGHAVAGRR